LTTQSGFSTSFFRPFTVKIRDCTTRGEDLFKDTERTTRQEDLFKDTERLGLLRRIARPAVVAIVGNPLSPS